ncbi:response regulator [Bacillaceae bacterium IKA-2]|nr:response regulator [Bacillaceae bacterium IKA-2]
MAKILIVDDSALMRLTLKNIVIEAGHEVVGEAGNGIEAIASFQSTQPELVTMDITMPEMDGIEALKAIKKINPKAIVVMCSAMVQQILVIEAIQSGAADFIVKPFNAERINESIDKVLSRSTVS